jgi:hypothetical protein|tara:strand:- start:378 stop:1040 length:663 start_codon:yes stop_codon:yes gene_type:complete
MSYNKTIALGAALVGLGAYGFHELPGMIGGDNLSANKWIDSFYCSVITLTTVGYGDICPSNPNDIGKLFLVVLSFLGLGFFCGPIMDFAASWRHSIPGGNVVTFAATLGLGVALFTQLEGMTPKDAAYYSVVTGTTIGYGDMSPKTDHGKIAAAFYALVAVNVVGALLDPCKEILQGFASDTGSFDDVDTSGDGVIDREEFAAMKKELDSLRKKAKKKKN